jgi:hypothetical protein
MGWSLSHPQLAITISRYQNGEVALLIHDDIDGKRDEAGIPATVAFEDAPRIAPRYVWLKGWSENEGVPDALVRAGFVRLTGEVFPTGFVEAQKAELLEPLLAEVMKVFGLKKGG